MGEKRFAVLVATSRYEDTSLNDLRSPRHDAEELNRLLISKEYGRFTEANLLENLPHNKVLRELNHVLNRAESDDLVLIYFSGHGKLNRQGELSLATVDTEVELLETTSIPVNRLRELFMASRSKKIVLILDCCFSGRVGKAFIKSGVSDSLQQVHEKSRGVYILTASTGIQVALEKEGEVFSHFTKYIIEGIRGNADVDEDGLISVSDLFDYASANMDKSQRPMKFSWDVLGTEFLISRSGENWLEKQERALYGLLSGQDQRLWNEKLADYTKKQRTLADDGELDLIIENVKNRLLKERAEMESQSGAGHPFTSVSADTSQILSSFFFKYASFRSESRYARYIIRIATSIMFASLLVMFFWMPMTAAIAGYGILSFTMGYLLPKSTIRLRLLLCAPILLLFGITLGTSIFFDNYLFVLLTADFPLFFITIIIALVGIYFGTHVSNRIVNITNEKQA